MANGYDDRDRRRPDDPERRYTGHRGRPPMDDMGRRRPDDDLRRDVEGGDRRYRGEPAGRRAWETANDDGSRDDRDSERRRGRPGYSGYPSDRTEDYEDRSSYPPEEDGRGNSRLGRDYEESSGLRVGEGPHRGRAAEGWPSTDAAGWQGRGEWSAGPHRGKGPKGYTRSDDRIREEVSDRLADHDRIDASEITVTVSDGEVTLDGTVGSRPERRLAEDVADACSGVSHVQNNLRVRAAGSEAVATSGQTAAQAAGKGRAKEA